MWQDHHRGELFCAYVTADSKVLGKDSEGPGAMGVTVTQTLDPFL